ncbi:hypothetical protein MLD38_020582 [Melastoma candidum]|uniref:Uncharacterized protein n=1 Tax=Melastoma candidum TaxID=119954 RepID=A0ACB9QDQ7_9MYRT|nr:hypothetical protein MLD38_020582 [Melastoma candidum]
MQMGAAAARGREDELLEGGEVRLGLRPTELPSGSVVGSGGILDGVESAEPDPGLLDGVVDLGDVATPGSLPNVTETALHPDGVKGCWTVTKPSMVMKSGSSVQSRKFSPSNSESKRQKLKLLRVFFVIYVEDVKVVIK